MDEIVKQAMAKWPNVPVCHGWLALDARGGWRMCDERAQALQLAGDRIAHPALLNFINRNYGVDDAGAWYFQNGPQRVFVDLAATPHIARTDPVLGFVLHTGLPLESIRHAWLSDDGQLLLSNAATVAQLDDRDLEQALALLHADGAASTEEAVLQTIRDAAQDLASAGLYMAYQGQRIPVTGIARRDLARRFGFNPRPRPDPG